MINQNNERITITISKAQAQWIKTICKKASITISKYISWTLAKKAEELLKVLNQNTTLYNYSEEEIKEILKTKWIKD